AREWIVEAFRAHGLEPEVQEDVVLRDASRNAEGRRHLHAMRVRNVVARREGAPRPASEASEGAPASRPKAVALFAHYDSVPTGPGAADDAAGVAVLLETLRALKASPPLPRDVLFVVTDGEEVGLMGARAFVERHDAAKDVGVALNFEARGHRGPSLMFQTSPENGGLIRTYAEAVARPVANSAGAEVYRRMPNDT